MRSTGERVPCATSARPDGYLERQLRRFRDLLERTQTRPLPRADELAERLEQQRPVAARDDARARGLPARQRAGAARPGRVSALLDWELATLGDPLADVGYLAATWSEPGSPGNALELSPVTRSPGLPVAGRARRALRRALGPRRLGPPLVHGPRALEGRDLPRGELPAPDRGQSDDPYYRGLDEGVPALLEEAWALR